MYFNHAFEKTFLGKNTSGNIDLVTSGSTASLTPAQIGLFDSKTYQAISAAPAAGTHTKFILAQGSLHTVDKLGQFEGGYQESVKSKEINPKYVSRLMKVTAKPAQSQILEIGDLAIQCGKTYDLRIDVKGSPVLRYLTHNLYHTVSAYSGCCTDQCTATCTGDPVDPTVVLLQWADQIASDPRISQFIRPIVAASTLATTGDTATTAGAAGARITNLASTTGVAVGDYVSGPGIAPGAKVTVVTSGTQVELDKRNTSAGTGSAIVFSKATTSDTYVPKTEEADIAAVQSKLRLEVAYVDTKFSNCVFSPKDFYEIEPIYTYLSITDDSGNPCAVRNIANSSPFDGVTEVQAPVQVSGTGEKVLRDLILSDRYRQDTFHEKVRLREVLNEGVVLDNTNRDGLYDQVHILHSVPRFNNPTGTFDNDQYLLTIHVPTGTNTVALTDLLEGIFESAGSGVVLEEF